MSDKKKQLYDEICSVVTTLNELTMDDYRGEDVIYDEHLYEKILAASREMAEAKAYLEEHGGQVQK